MYEYRRSAVFAFMIRSIGRLDRELAYRCNLGEFGSKFRLAMRSAALIETGVAVQKRRDALLEPSQRVTVPKQMVIICGRQGRELCSESQVNRVNKRSHGSGKSNLVR
jgi:hypothetical protein